MVGRLAWGSGGAGGAAGRAAPAPAAMAASALAPERMAGCRAVIRFGIGVSIWDGVAGFRCRDIPEGVSDRDRPGPGGGFGIEKVAGFSDQWRVGSASCQLSSSQAVISDGTNLTLPPILWNGRDIGVA